MTIRAFSPSDIDELKRLHSIHFAHQFDMPDFMKYICAFVVEDEKGIITAGGIRDIAECVLVTNMDRDPKERARALYQMLDASTFVCRNMDYDQMYIWVRDLKYHKRLQKNGFRPSDGQSLILDL